MSALASLAARPVDQPVDGRVPFFIDVPGTRSIMDDTKAAAWDGKELELGTPTKGDLLLDGYASTWVLDRDYEYVSRRAFDSTLKPYLQKNPIMLWQHLRDKPFGQVLDGGIDETGLAINGWIRKAVAGEEPWKVSAFQDVKAGIVRTLSIGGFMEREVVENEVLIVKVDLFEISVVSIPSNPDSIFEAAVKAAKGLPLTSTSEQVVQQMSQLLGMYPVTDPQLARLDEQGKMERYAELSVMFVQGKGVQPPGYNDYREVESNFESNPDEALKAVGDMLLTLGTADKAPVNDGKALDAMDAKKGRVLSGKNERTLEVAQHKVQEAADQIGKVLNQVRSSDEDGEGERSAKQLDSDVMEQLRDGGTERWGDDDIYVYVDDYDIDESWAVFCVISPDERQYLRVEYTRDKDGVVALGDQEEPVRRVVDYEPEQRSAPDDLDQFFKAVDQGDEKASCTSGSWDGSASRFTDAQYRRSCILDRKDCGDVSDVPVKQRYSLPIREPGGAINKNALSAAAGRLNQVSACATAKSKAKGRLKRAYSACGMDPPESLTD